MSLILVLQLVLGVVALGLVAQRMRVLLFVAPLDTKPYVRALGAAFEDGDEDAVEFLVDEGQPAWVAAVGRQIARAERDPESDLEEFLSDLRYEAFKGLRALRTLASVGTATGFLGAIVEIIWLLEGDHGLTGLKAGLPQQIAVEGAMNAMAAGVAIAIFAFSSLTVLKRAAVHLVGDVERAARTLSACRERSLASG